MRVCLGLPTSDFFRVGSADLRVWGPRLFTGELTYRAVIYNSTHNKNRIYKVVGSVKHNPSATSFLSVLGKGSPISVARFHHTSIRSRWAGPRWLFLTPSSTA